MSTDDLLALNNAFDELRGRDLPMAQVIEVSYLAGFTVMEITAALGVSERTVARHCSLPLFLAARSGEVELLGFEP